MRGSNVNTGRDGRYLPFVAHGMHSVEGVKSGLFGLSRILTGALVSNACVKSG